MLDIKRASLGSVKPPGAIPQRGHILTWYELPLHLALYIFPSFPFTSWALENTRSHLHRKAGSPQMAGRSSLAGQEQRGALVTFPTGIFSADA